MPATAPIPEIVTLPRLAIELRESLDNLRRRFKASAELRDLSLIVGSARCVRSADLDRIKELLAR